MVERAKTGEEEALGVWRWVCLEEQGWERGAELWHSAVLRAGYPV